MNNLIGRANQIQDLEEALSSNKPEMVALIGRRRIGKTYLVKRVYENRINFELTGIQHANKKEQIQNFLVQIAKFCSDFELNQKPGSWLEAFFMLAKALESQKNRRNKSFFWMNCHG
jgi:AAA+ ATPase superfamily predicted ATPase